MQQQGKKSIAAAESNSADNTSRSVSTGPGPRPGQSSTALSTEYSCMRRRSHSGLQFDSHTHHFTSSLPQESTSKEDCAQQRFTTWATDERNTSVCMAANKWLRCPLLLCGKHCAGYEDLLRHLTQCQHLSTGEFVCHQCMRVERFNDEKCACSLGYYTKGKRTIDIAKEILSKINGAKSRWQSLSPPTHNAQPSALNHNPPAVDMHEQYGQVYLKQSVPQEESLEEQNQVEPRRDPVVNGMELLEVDSTPMNHDTRPVVFLDLLPEEETLPFPTPNLTSKSRPSPSIPNLRRSKDVALRSETRRPSLVLNTQIDRYKTTTHTTYLSPSSSPRSDSHGISPITPLSASPKSAAMWSEAPIRGTMLASPVTPLSADTLPTAPQANRVFSSEKEAEMQACPEDPCHRGLKYIPDISEDKQLPDALRVLSDPIVFPCNPEEDFPWASYMDTDSSFSTSVNMMFTDSSAKSTISSDLLGPQIPVLETKLLVEKVWSALGERFASSFPRLSQLPNNPLANDLRTQTLSIVASAGLTRLKKSIDYSHHSRPEPFEYLCFVLLICSISVVINEDGYSSQLGLFYEQAMAYGAGFDASMRDNYYHTITAIWPQNAQLSTSSRVRARSFGNGSATTMGKESDGHPSHMDPFSRDPLVTMGQDFLDELEKLVVKTHIQQPVEVLDSELWTTHLHTNQTSMPGNTSPAMASTYIVQDLSRRYYESEGFPERLELIGQNARGGYYSTIRKLELELLRAGKDHLVSYGILDQYKLDVRNLCDQFYTQTGTQQRVQYHLLGISLVEGLIRSVARETQQPQEGHAEYSLVPYQYEDEMLRDFSKTLPWSYGMMPITQQPISAEGVANFGSSLDLTTLHSVGSSAHAATASPSRPPITSDASDTPSESYAVSPAPLSDIPPELTASHAYTSTPQFQDQGTRGETFCHSGLGSTGQKVEASERCETCGYRPKGDPQWFKGSMAKHKKMQHSTNPPIIYKCPFPGCNSEYKNRRDNLRQHQIEKNHFVGDEAQRPQKRKRKDHA